MYLVGYVYIFCSCLINLESFFAVQSDYGFVLCLLNYSRTCFDLCLGFSSRYLPSWTRRHMCTFESPGIFVSHLISDGMISLLCTSKQIDIGLCLGHLRMRPMIFPNLLMEHVGHGLGSCDFSQSSTSLGLSSGFFSRYFSICWRLHDFSFIFSGVALFQWTTVVISVNWNIIYDRRLYHAKVQVTPIRLQYES